MLNSLKARLLVASVLWSFIGLFLAGFLLVGLYRNTVIDAFDRNLLVYTNVLAGEVSFREDPRLVLGDRLAEPRFSLVLSGWYWSVAERGGEVLASSDSLFAELLPDVPLTAENQIEERVYSIAADGPTGRKLRIVSRSLMLGDREVVVNVSGDTTQLVASISGFRNTVAAMLTGLGVFLALSTFFLIRWGLRPLINIASALNDIREGKTELLTGKFPTEISPLVRELNALISFNQKVIERARTHVGNLAHALKTPISVLRNEASDASKVDSAKVSEQIQLMQNQVSYHLDRARIVARTSGLSASHPVREIIGGLVRVMEKVYREKEPKIEIKCPEKAVFAGERQDLEEVLGNLIENACKWCASQVYIVVIQEKGKLIISVEDDGPGLSVEQRTEAVKRGRRLDETTPGTGLGLSIVSDLVDAYEGEFQLSEAKIGGLKAQVSFSFEN